MCYYEVLHIFVTYILFHGKFQIRLALQSTVSTDRVDVTELSSKVGLHISTDQILYGHY